MKPIIQPGLPRYHTPSAPESTVLNYALAWEQRDSTMIDSVLTDDYLGNSVDQTDPSSGTLTFTKADEIRAVGELVLDPLVAGVTVSLGALGNPTSYPGDPPDWLTLEARGNVRVAVYFTNANDLYCTGSGLEFKLKPTVSASGTTWKIIRWTEVHN